MKTRPVRTPLLALAATVLGAQRGAAQNVDVAWVIPSGSSLSPEATTVGGTATFTWSGYHNVYMHPSGTCDEANAVLVGSTSPAAYTFTSDNVGDVIFACDVGTHCESGQIVTVTVSEAAVANTDCSGSWSACTTACEAAADRTWSETTAQSGTGAACLATTDCADGEGDCVAVANTDCSGSWSACTTACEAAADRTWSETTAQSGTGAACPAVIACGNGDGSCVVTTTAVGTVNADLTVDAVLATILADGGTFAAGFVIDVSTLLGCSASQVVITNIAAGSVIVSFAVTPAADGTPVAASALTAAFSGVVSLPTAGVSTIAAISTPAVVTAPAPASAPSTSAGMKLESAVAAATATATALVALTL
jgi:hypothetical protein